MEISPKLSIQQLSLKTLEYQKQQVNNFIFYSESIFTFTIILNLYLFAGRIKQSYICRGKVTSSLEATCIIVAYQYIR